MRMRSRRRNPAVWKPSAGSADRYRALSFTRITRPRRIRWWLHAGMVVSVIGLRRLARTARTRWRPIFLVAGALLLVTGILRPGTMAFVPGMLVLGLAAPSRDGLPSPTTAMVRAWSRKGQADHL